MADLPPRLTGSQIRAEVSREVAAIRAEIPERGPNHRCRVCLDPESRMRVNRLLAFGMKAAEIVHHVEDLNDRRPKNSKITYWSIKGHAERHFNLQEPVAAARRRILERRKEQASEELVEAATNLLTGLGYLDIVAQKGFENLLDENTVVDYETGLKAQLKLEEMQREGEFERKIVEMRRDVSILQQAVKDVVPSQMMTEILARIDELRGTSKDEFVDAEIIEDDEDDDDDVGIDPILTSDSEDALGED